MDREDQFPVTCYNHSSVYSRRIPQREDNKYPYSRMLLTVHGEHSLSLEYPIPGESVLYQHVRFESSARLPRHKSVDNKLVT